MIIPLRTDHPIRRRPVVTYGIVAATVLVHIVILLLTRQQPERADMLFGSLMLRPGSEFNWWTLATCALLHAGWLHLFMNMIFLYAFGPALEDRLGHVGFAALYVGGAVASSAGHLLFDGNPAIGASGAVAAVTGVFLVLFPRSLVRCFSLLFFLGQPFFDIAAWWLIAFQIAWNFLGIAVMTTASIAWFAHLAGYAFGIALAMSLLKLKLIPSESTDLVYAMRQAKRRRELREAGEIFQQRQQRVMREAGKPTQEEPDPAAGKRAEVTRAIVAGDRSRMLELYRELVAEHESPDSILASSHQIAIGNQAMTVGDHELARRAYDDYLSRHHSDREATTIKLMLGLVLIRYLDDKPRGRALVRAAKGEGLDDDHGPLADALLEEAGPNPLAAERDAKRGAAS